MKRKGTRRPRDREKEELIKMTTLNLSEGEMVDRHKADKTNLENRLRNLFEERKVLRNLCLNHSDADPTVMFRGVQCKASHAFNVISCGITLASANLRAVKNALAVLEPDHA